MTRASVFTFEDSILQASDVLRFNRILVRSIEPVADHASNMTIHVAMLGDEPIPTSLHDRLGFRT